MTAPHGIPEIIAGASVVAMQAWKRNPVLSILLGTALYMLLSVSPEDYARFMADPIHPTLEGYCKWWSPYIEREICSIIKI